MTRAQFLTWALVIVKVAFVFFGLQGIWNMIYDATRRIRHHDDAACE
jgi:hypothetical protein